MTRLWRAEWRKLMTTRLWWGMLLGAVALAALGVVAQIASNGVKGNFSTPLSAGTTQRQIAASASSGYLFSIVVGIIMITTEFRHFTSRPTFLIEPRRGRVIIAKLLMSVVIGVIYGVACAGTAAAIMIPWLAAKHVTIGWFSDDVFRALIGAVLVITIFTVVGVGVGVLVRNQIAAVIGALAYLFVAEPLISIIPVVKEAYRYLPGAAAAAIDGASRGQVELVTALQGCLLLLAWGLLFAVCGWVFTVRRDIP